MDTMIRHLRRAVLRQDGQLLAPFLDQKDASGAVQRWVEITVGEIRADEQIAPPAATAESGSQQKAGKK
jgi:hypothetical protein